MTDTARLLLRGLGGEAPDDEQASRILDAALELVAGAGVRHLTMDDVAERARVGRMTVYRRFGTRQRLLDALAAREAGRCLAEIAGAFDAADPFADRAADVFVAVLRVIREHPLLERLARVEPGALLDELTRDDSEAFALVRDFLVAQVELAQAAGEIVVVDPQALAELALRLGASFVLIPDGVFTERDDAGARTLMRSVIEPFAA